MSIQLQISGTSTTPEIIFDSDNGLLSFLGSSYPEQADTFYSPIYQQIEAALQTPMQKLKISCAFIFINSSSLKQVLKILMMIEQHYQPDYEYELYWYHEPDDVDLRNEGEVICTMLTMPRFIVQREFISDGE